MEFAPLGHPPSSSVLSCRGRCAHLRNSKSVPEGGLFEEIAGSLGEPDPDAPRAVVFDPTDADSVVADFVASGNVVLAALPTGDRPAAASRRELERIQRMLKQRNDRQERNGSTYETSRNKYGIRLAVSTVRGYPVL
jgi:hypothetical protein